MLLRLLELSRGNVIFLGYVPYTIYVHFQYTLSHLHSSSFFIQINTYI